MPGVLGMSNEIPTSLPITKKPKNPKIYARIPEEILNPYGLEKSIKFLILKSEIDTLLTEVQKPAESTNQERLEALKNK